MLIQTAHGMSAVLASSLPISAPCVGKIKQNRVISATRIMMCPLKRTHIKNMRRYL